MRASEMSLRQWILTAALALAVGAPAHAAGGIVVFGTSLSDPGNAFALLGATNTAPDYSVDLTLVPDRPYARGGQHFSNGGTWIEQYARPLGFAASVQPAFRDGGARGTNYAFGGARARDENSAVPPPQPTPPGLSVQVGAFLRDAGAAAPSDALYVVEMGGNDLRDALVAANDNDRIIILNDAIRSIVGNIGQLYAAGARKFLLWSAPDLGLTPAILTIDRFRPGTAGGATFLSMTFNTFLDQAVAQNLGGLPGISIRRLDAFTKLNEIVSRPAAFGLTNVNTACIMPNVAPFVCSDPDSYLFWDGIHPTAAGHAIIAHEAARVLSQ